MEDGQDEGTLSLIIANLAFQPALLPKSRGRHRSALLHQQTEQNCQTEPEEEEQPLEESGCAMAQLSEPLSATCGYGLMGVTRNEGMQKRLQMLRYTLIAAMQRLSSGATMIVSWSGLPDHPVLVFL